MSRYLVTMNGSSVRRVCEAVEGTRWLLGSQSFHGGGSSSRRGRGTARPVMPERGTYFELAGDGWELWHGGPSEDGGSQYISQMRGGGAWHDMGGDSSQIHIWEMEVLGITCEVTVHIMLRIWEVEVVVHNMVHPFTVSDDLCRWFIICFPDNRYMGSHEIICCPQDHSQMTYAGGSQSTSQMAGTWDLRGSFVDPHDLSQMIYAGGLQSHIHTPPAQGFTEFAHVLPSSSSEEEHNEEAPQRQQPARNVKGKGRRCFTGTHVLWWRRRK